MWNGKWCVRAHQPVVHNPRTEAQEAHRSMFKQEVQLAARMRWAVTTALRDAGRMAGMTSYNLFVSLNQSAFGYAEGRLTVDYPTLRLSVGEVAPTGQAEATLGEGNVLDVRFRAGDGNGLDHVYLYVYAPEAGRGTMAAPVYRRQRHVELLLPDEYAGCELHAYLMVKKADGRWSESVYVEVDGQTPEVAASLGEPEADEVAAGTTRLAVLTGATGSTGPDVLTGSPPLQDSGR